jgi:hypothetical protein
MNAYASLSRLMTSEDAHVLRSRLLDAFADAEAVVAEFARTAAKPVSEAASLGQRIQCARTVKPGPALSKERHARIANELDRLSGLLAIRADIVHARLQFGLVDNVPVMIFRNAGSTAADHPQVRMFRAEEFERLLVSVQAVARSLNQAVTPPLPPRPVPDAAGDP